MQQIRQLADLPGPSTLPLIGNVHQLGRDRIHLVLEAWADEFGSVYRLRFGTQSVLATSDPEMVRELLQDRPAGFRRMSRVQEIFNELGVNGLFSAEGEDWYRQRRLLMPFFRPKHLAALHPIIVRGTRALIERLDLAVASGEAVDAHKLLTQFSVDVTTEISFGYQLKTLQGENAEFQRHLSRLFPCLNERLKNPFAYWRWIRLPRDRAVDRAMLFLRVFVEDIVENTRGQLSREPSLREHPQNFLQSLLSFPDTSEDPPPSKDEIFANVITLLLAGEDTTANGLAWALHHLALEPGLQTRAAREARKALGSEDVVEAFRDTGRLKFNAAVIEEVLRVRSPGPFFFLEANHDTVVSGVALPKGTPVLVLTRHVGMQASQFSEPARFMPDRWLQEGEASPDWIHTPRAQLAFGAGARGCPGRSLAMLESQVVMSALLKRFEFEHATLAEHVSECFQMTMFPQNLRLSVKHRTD